MTVDLSGARWFKSSFSQPSGECVEIALVGGGADHVGVRDSKDPGGPALVFTGEQWDRFLSSGVWKR
ncbi:DUF397 domain-containing protein [Nocardia sp. SYP-A9097]|uniref:DUF397 domain-containing protein n=1 Tax=Nocardia sp. SYP-A9097 TaxID=2663237 RepID=UPI00129BC842|nr:DUF397 domain-containing protein [Nocardia sp. SYP-A9097]MRH90889.1 DUF397 domain-containing protein [Nocardia sp. SYP-A9097]